MLVLHDSIDAIMILWNKRFFRHLHVCLATSIHKKITATRKKTTEKDTCARWHHMILTHWHPASFEEMVLLSTKWPFLALFDPISSQSLWKVLSTTNSCPFLSVSGLFLALWVQACTQFKIWRQLFTQKLPVYGSSRFSAQAHCFCSHFDFRFLLLSKPCDHGFWWWEKFGLKARLKRKELAKSSSRWEGHDDFLVFWR